MYSLRLKHMVSDKLHMRAMGQVTALFRQPLEGFFKAQVICKSIASLLHIGKTIGSGKILRALNTKLR